MCARHFPFARGLTIMRALSGPIAQLGERCVRNAEVGSSILLRSTRNSNTRQRTTLKSVVRCLVDGFPISSPGCDGTLASAVFSARSPGAASQPCDTGAAPVGVPFSMTCRRTGRLRRSFRYAARGPRRPPRFRPTRGGGDKTYACAFLVCRCGRRVLHSRHRRRRHDTQRPAFHGGLLRSTWARFCLVQGAARALTAAEPVCRRCCFPPEGWGVVRSAPSGLIPPWSDHTPPACPRSAPGRGKVEQRGRNKAV